MTVIADQSQGSGRMRLEGLLCSITQDGSACEQPEEVITDTLHTLGANLAYCTPKQLPVILAALRFLIQKHTQIVFTHAHLLFAGLGTAGGENHIINSFPDPLIAISVTTELLSCAADLQSSVTKSLVQLWCRLVARIFLSSRKSHKVFIKNTTKFLLAKNPAIGSLIVERLKSDEFASHSILLLASAISDQLNSFEEYSMLSVTLMEKLLQALFNTKSPLPKHLLPAYTASISTCLTPDLFKSLVIPSVHRAILRSAEANMVGVDAIVNMLSFDLDYCAVDLIQPIVKHLYALSDPVRRSTVAVLTGVVSRCSEPDTVTSLLKLTYAQITGPEGKKAGQEARLAGLTCLGEMSRHGAKRTAASDKIGHAAVCLFMDIMEQESHEETLIYASKQLAKWVSRFKSTLPDRFLSFIKIKAFDPKTPAAVRCAYLMCLDSGFTKVNIGDRLPSAFPANLLTSVQRAIGQPNHSPLVFESVCASLIWIRHFVAKSKTIDSELVKTQLGSSPIWTLLVASGSSSKRRPWFSERFLQTAPEFVLEKLATLLVILLRQLNPFIPRETKSYVFRTLLLLGIHPHYTTVRQPALSCIKDLLRDVSEEYRLEYSTYLLGDVACFLLESDDDTRVVKVQSESSKLQKASETSTTVSPFDNVGPRVWNELTCEPESEPPGLCNGRQRSRCLGSYVAKLICDIVMPSALLSGRVQSVDFKTSVNGPKEQKSKWTYEVPETVRHALDIYLSSLVACSHDTVATSDPSLWERLRHRIGLPDLWDDSDWIPLLGADYLRTKWTGLVDYFMNIGCLDHTHTRALQRLVNWSPSGFGRVLFDVLFKKLSDPSLISASVHEVNIMMTPETQLYNQELLESLPKYKKTLSNIKRESKLYSYDEQLDMMAAKRQREEMLKKSSVTNDPPLIEALADQLTEKQLEAVRAELAKEAEIRQRMLQLDTQARHLTNLLTQSLQACLSKFARRTSQSTLAAGNLAVYMCPKLSGLLHRLLTSPLVAPYILRAYLRSISLTMRCEPKLDRQCELIAPVIGWWSVRVLGPARLLLPADLDILLPTLDGMGMRLRNAHKNVLMSAMRDATNLLTHWSEEPIVAQTTRILTFLRSKFPQRSINGTVLWSFLCPNQEFLLLASGWARPLFEELVDLSFPALMSDDPGQDSCVASHAIIPLSVRKQWSWITSEHVCDMLAIWQHQLHDPIDGCLASETLSWDRLMHVLPFSKLFRLLRQVVEGSITDLDAYAVSADQHLLSNKDEESESTDVMADISDEDHLNHSKALAQVAMDIMRSATNLLSQELSVSDTLDSGIRQLANSVLNSLLTGTVAETPQAREICLSCILILTEKIPSFVEKADLDDKAVWAEGCGLTSIPSVPTNDKEVDHDHECEDLDDSEPQGNDPAKPRKKLNKNQRRKHKQAQMVADLAKAQGGAQVEQPYESPALWPVLPLWQKLQVRVWVARSDASAEVASLAERLWVSLGLHESCEQPCTPEEQHSHGMLPLLDTPKDPLLLKPMLLAQRLLLETTRPIAPVQKATADAFALCLMRRTPDEIAVSLEQLIRLYKVMLYREPAVRDNIGRILVPESADRWRERVGLAFALTRLPEALNPSDVAHRSLRPGLLVGELDQVDGDQATASVEKPSGEGEKASRTDTWLINMFRFLVPDGLNDRHPAVQSVMLKAGLRAVAVYGKAHLDRLLPILETFLNKAPNVAELDAVRQSVLILTGSLSQHLSADDPRVWNIFNRLLGTLNFPSDVVQQAVEDCLASLVTKLSEEQKTKTVTRLMSTLLGASSYAERHGAAHGIAGVARGLGILSLKHYGIIDKLIPALEDTKSAKHREGALLAVERLCLGMGRLFEPYIFRLISGLLTAFGDSSPSVREAASGTARAIMSKLSAHGVRLILPALLRAIDEQQSWRTKAQSVELLATMTHCAPKQLSACLPQIVPRLLDVLVDSQDQLKQAGVRALKQIGNVIRNPEVQALVPLLTGCLQDPLADKMPCLLALRDTCFVHVLDAPSLALILPVIQRAFADRSTESRKSAAQIFGNLHSLARKEELQPYVPNIVPSLKACLLDAVPEIRSVAAAALGALVRGMGESCFTEILPWLLSTLTSETSSVDRSGAAQGLAEVLGAMGIERLRSILPDFIRTAASDSKVAPHVRDGYLMLFVYLPTVFRDSFAEFIGPIIPTILNSLSDETEFLRETALRAAQRIVQMFAETSVELLLPELERGIADPNWRIRHASVKLLGDLLYQLSGLSGKGTTKTEDEDDTFGTSAAHERLSAIMGSERHDRVLARLHMVRSDPSLFVRQVAVHVWKVVVPNTSRTLREIMPVLIRLILDTLGTSNREQQQLAARALGDVVRKLGERILPEIIPLLVAGLNSPEPNHRRGVCTGLMELMRNCPREQLFNYTDSLLIPIRRTLCDELPEVRRSGARTFEILYGALGVRCLDGVLPDILAQLDDPKTSPYALDGLRQLLVVKGKAVMPYLVPKLIYPTVNAKAFAYLATVAGDALSRQLNRILPALLTTVAQADCNPDHEEDVTHCAEVLICIYDLAGVRYIFNTLLSGLVVGSSSTSTTTGGSAPTVTPNQVTAGTPAYRTACLRLLNAYLNVSFEEAEVEAVPMATTLGQTIGSTQAGARHSEDTDEEDESDEEDEDFDEDEDGEDEDEDEDSDDMDTDSNLDEGADEDIPDSKESVSKVLREFYPLALRNICRLLALHDTPTLSRSWDCLEALFKRWTPETVTSQISDLRQGIRGAVSELHRTSKGKSGEDAFLPGFSDPNLPLASLVKLYADCTLRGQPDVKEPAAQALSECITHASGSALQRCVVKVLGPLIRLLGERQTNVVRMAVVESLTSLITKCSQSARPFVTQLQATFLKCLGDSHRPMRLLGCHGLASVAAITPKLDPLLMDLARVPAHTVLSNWPGERIPGITKPDSTLPSVGAAATALTLTGIATYPETSLHALRLCLLGSRGRATMDALNSVVCSLAPLMFLQDTGSKQQQVEDVAFGDTEEDEEDDINLRGVGGQSKKINPVILADAIRVVASVCIGCTVAAAHATLSNAPANAETVEDAMLQPVRLLEQYLFPKTTIKAHEHWTFQQSQALILLTALKHAPGAVINAQTLLTPVVSRLERLLSNLCSADKTIVCQLGLRAVGCFVGHVVETSDVKYDLNGPLQLLNKGLMHDLVDIRSLTTTVTSHIAWRSHLSDNDPVPSWLPPFLAVLMNAMRDKASGVRVGGETALVVLCRIGAPKESQLSASLVRLCVDGIDPASRSILDTTIQKLRKQNWSEVWSQGCPDMEIILT